jgi:hypothetical protein
MAPVNSKNVQRTNFLLGHPYGTDFVYDEMMVAPGVGELARVTTETFATMVSLVASGGLKPGVGPSREEREKGFYDILFLGELPDGGRVEAVVTGDGDPGYGSTSKMIAESALYLVRDVQGEGGIWRRTLRQRSQKDWTTWERTKRLADDWLPKPRILHPWPESRFAVRHPRWEPYARIGPVRICAGGAR